MRERGNCPECHLRNVTHRVTDPSRPPIELCEHCASVYEWKYVERFSPRP